MPRSLANGQLAASAGTLLAGSTLLGQEVIVDVDLSNTSATTTEVVVLTVSRAAGTARRKRRIQLAPNETATVTGITIDPTDTLSGSTTNATTVDYDITVNNGAPPGVVVRDAAGSAKASQNLASATNLTVSGDFERSLGSTDNTHQNRVRVFEDFLADAAATLPTPWGVHDTSSAGTPVTTYVADALNGEFTLTHDTQSEQQNLALYWADQLTIDPTKNPVFECRLKINFAGATFTADQRIVIGLAAARNATLDSNATHAWFRIEGANLNILWETDDTSTDDDDNDSTYDIVDNTYLTLRIDLSDLTSIKFYVNDQLAGGGTAAAALTASHKLQPYIEIQRDAGAEAESVVIDYICCEWDRV